MNMMLTIKKQRRSECVRFKMRLLFNQPNQVRCISAILASNLLICKCVESEVGLPYQFFAVKVTNFAGTIE